MIHERAKIGLGTFVWHECLSNIGVCEIGEDSIIHSHVWIGDGVKIGKHAKIQAFAFIPKGVSIGDNVFIGPRVTFTNDKHPPSFGRGWELTTVEDNVSVGAGAIILPGLTLGKGCIVGAGAVVTKNVEPGVTVIGNPARPL